MFRSESLLNTTTEKLGEVENSLKVKADLIAELEAKLGNSELKNAAVTENINLLPVADRDPG